MTAKEQFTVFPSNSVNVALISTSSPNKAGDLCEMFKNVHPFYSTFALGRDVEWACRQFVLEMKEEDEEGIGTFLNITHKSPACSKATSAVASAHEHCNSIA